MESVQLFIEKIQKMETKIKRHSSTQ